MKRETQKRYILYVYETLVTKQMTIEKVFIIHMYVHCEDGRGRSLLLPFPNSLSLKNTNMTTIDTGNNKCHCYWVA